jgi:hypothetical protein
LDEDIKYASTLYNIPSLGTEEGYEEWFKTDDVLQKYLGHEIEISHLASLPHQKSFGISVWATILGGAATGLLYYAATRDSEAGWLVGGVDSIFGLLFLDLATEESVLISNPYILGVLTGFRIGPPALVALYYGGGSLIRGIRNFKNERTGLRPR